MSCVNVCLTALIMHTYARPGHDTKIFIMNATQPPSITLPQSKCANTYGNPHPGHDTKIFMNATQPPSKRSQVERTVDAIILFMFSLLFSMCLVGCVYFASWTVRRAACLLIMLAYHHTFVQNHLAGLLQSFVIADSSFHTCTHTHTSTQTLTHSLID